MHAPGYWKLKKLGMRSGYGPLRNWAPNAKRRFLPSSIGLTVLLPPDVREIEARVCWGDYRTEPPLPNISEATMR